MVTKKQTTKLLEKKAENLLISDLLDSSLIDNGIVFGMKAWEAIEPIVREFEGPKYRWTKEDMSDVLKSFSQAVAYRYERTTAIVDWKREEKLQKQLKSYIKGTRKRIE